MRTRLRPLLACAVVVLSAIGATACGKAGNSSDSAQQGSTAAPATAGVAATLASTARDGDGDNDAGHSGSDGDNDAEPTYGPPADAADRQKITALLKRYYEAAAAGDGAKACSLTYWLFAESIVEEHHRGHGPPSLRGNTCAQVASKLFKQRHRELVKDLAAFQVTTMQIVRKLAYVVLRFGVAREYLVLVHRTNGVWQVNALLDSGAF